MSDLKYQWLKDVIFPKESKYTYSIFGSTKEDIFRKRIQQKASVHRMPKSFNPLSSKPDAYEIFKVIQKDVSELRGLIHILPLANSIDEALLFLTSEWYRLRGNRLDSLIYIGRVIKTGEWNQANYKKTWSKVSQLVTKYKENREVNYG